MIPPTLETPRLLLRPPGAADFDAFAEFAADEEAARYLGGTLARAPAWRAWCAIVGAWEVRGFSMFSVIEKATGRWVGRVGPWMPEGWPGAEIGWGITRDRQRLGYGKEAGSAALDWAFESLGWTEAVHCIQPPNGPSIALAESLGSRLLRRGVRAPAPLDAVWDLYGQSRDEWRARRAAHVARQQ